MGVRYISHWWESQLIQLPKGPREFPFPDPHLWSSTGHISAISGPCLQLVCSHRKKAQVNPHKPQDRHRSRVCCGTYPCKAELRVLRVHFFSLCLCQSVISEAMSSLVIWPFLLCQSQDCQSPSCSNCKSVAYTSGSRLTSLNPDASSNLLLILTICFGSLFLLGKTFRCSHPAGFPFAFT